MVVVAIRPIGLSAQEEDDKHVLCRNSVLTNVLRDSLRHYSPVYPHHVHGQTTLRRPSARAVLARGAEKEGGGEARRCPWHQLKDRIRHIEVLERERGEKRDG